MQKILPYFDYWIMAPSQFHTLITSNFTKKKFFTPCSMRIHNLILKFFTFLPPTDFTILFL